MAYYYQNFLGTDDLQAAAFDYLRQGFYYEAIDGFQEVIRRLYRKSCRNGTLQNLGKLRRGLAQALYCHSGNKSQDALWQIELCISEGNHEYSEESANFWGTLADKRGHHPSGRQSAIIGYEIALYFVPPCNVLLTASLLSKMMLLCCKAGPSFAEKATILLKKAKEIQMCPSQVSVSFYSASVGIKKRHIIDYSNDIRFC
ncbi:uncharacterized protein LOC111333645 [Stylophora pistillata]|uniref:uncharacterized protein LOC111333645 n=1 Tax=Stylophora pistillata TaxID=50429 RepID=UPI000C03AB5D|nr:uncharacterized protein LOC111333645 [Stylophora pistillata]